MSNRFLDKGTAFITEERHRLGLHGLLPPLVEDLDTQLIRVRVEYEAKSMDIERHIFLRLLQHSAAVARSVTLASAIEQSAWSPAS